MILHAVRWPITRRDHDATADHFFQAMATIVAESPVHELFESELHTTGRNYLLQARLLWAMGVLTQPDQTVLRAATAVGFASGSACARAFTERCGESPSDYRKRITSLPAEPD
jgi:transcriptional regulator GlxA family with amidase domain